MIRLISLISVSALLFSVSAQASSTLVAAWDFEDQGAGGTTADVSGVTPALNGTLDGPTIIDSGDEDRGYVANPAGSGILLGTSSKMQTFSKAMTIQFWAKKQNPAEQWKFVIGRDDGCRVFNMNGGILWEPATSDSGWNPLNIWAPDFANPQIWHHYILTYDGTDLYFYLDGALFGEPHARGGTINNSSNYWALMRAWSEAAGGNWNDGIICTDFLDDVAVWRGYATADVAAGLYNGTYTIYNAPIYEFAPIEGTVTDGSDPIEAVTMVLYNENLEEIDSTTTDASGSYLLAPPQNGSYYVAALPSQTGMHYINELYNNTTSFEDASLITVNSPVLITGINFALGESGAIKGTVVDNEENPLEDILVIAENADDEEALTSQAITDSDGKYTLAGLPPGDYFLYVSDNSYPTTYYEDTRNLQNASRVTITGTDTTENINFSITPYLPLTISKCTINSGKTEGADCISLSGTFADSLGDLNDISEVDVTIISSIDNYEVYSETLGFNPGDLRNNKYNYKHAAGAITAFKFDLNKGTISLTAKNINLHGLRCPLAVIIGFGPAVLSGQVTETVANGSKPVPMIFLKNHDNAIRVVSVRATSTSLWIKGAIALNDVGSMGVIGHKYNFTACGSTIAAWIKPSRTDGDWQWRYIAGPGGDGPRLFQMGNEIKFGTTVNPGDWVHSNLTTSGANLEADTWYHIAGVHYYNANDPTKSAMYIYVNGVILASLEEDPSCSTNPSGLIYTPYSIGNDVNPDSGGFSGNIDDVTIFNRPLTQAQITKLMNGNYKGAIAHWNFEDGVGSATAADISNYNAAANGQLLGTTSIVSNGGNRGLVLSCDGSAGNYVDTDWDFDLSRKSPYIRWGDSVISIPSTAFSFLKIGGKFAIYNDNINGVIDFNKCEFILFIKNQTALTTSGTVEFGISFDGFNESVEVGL